MHDVMKKQREARRKIIRQWTRLPKDRRQSMEEILNSPGPPRGRTKTCSSAVVAIHMRRSWDGYCHVLISSKRPSPLHINCPDDGQTSLCAGPFTGHGAAQVKPAVTVVHRSRLAHYFVMLSGFKTRPSAAARRISASCCAHACSRPAYPPRRWCSYNCFI